MPGPRQRRGFSREREGQRVESEREQIEEGKSEIHRIVFHHAAEQRAHQIVGERGGDVDPGLADQAGEDDAGKEQRHRQHEAAHRQLHPAADRTPSRYG